MASKLKVTSRPASTIRHSGQALRTLGPDAVAKALGAEAVPREDVHGAPISLHALRRQLEIRVRSTGGRPSLEGATKIQKSRVDTSSSKSRLTTPVRRSARGRSGGRSPASGALRDVGLRGQN